LSCDVTSLAADKFKMANGPDKCQKKNRRLIMTQNDAFNMPEGSGESERRAGRGLYVAHHAVALFQ
jgi:hypothetical protein